MSALIYCLGRDFLGRAGGGESYINSHALSASQIGLKPEIFSLARRSETLDLGYTTIRRTGTPGFDMRPEYVELYKYRLVPPIVRRLHEEPGPHVIHSFGQWVTAGQAATDELRKHGVDVHHIATVWELIGPHTHAKLENELIVGNWARRIRHRALARWVNSVATPSERRGLQAADRVIVNYQRLADLIADECGDGVDVAILPYATATAFEPAEVEYELPDPVSSLKAQEGPLIVATSRHAARKGIDVLVEALALLRDDGLAFRAAITGKGMLLGAHRKLIGELGLEDRVTMPGVVPDVRSFLAHADIHCLPSLAEGSGSMSTIEALQFGVPAVSSAIDGMVEDLTDGVDALLTKPGDVEDTARAIRSLIVDSELRNRIGAAGKELFANRFSVAAQNQALADLYADFGLTVSRDGAPGPNPALSAAQRTRGL